MTSSHILFVFFGLLLLNQKSFGQSVEENETENETSTMPTSEEKGDRRMQLFNPRGRLGMPQMPMSMPAGPMQMPMHHPNMDIAIPTYSHPFSDIIHQIWTIITMPIKVICHSIMSKIYSIPIAGPMIVFGLRLVRNIALKILSFPIRIACSVILFLIQNFILSPMQQLCSWAKNRHILPQQFRGAFDFVKTGLKGVLGGPPGKSVFSNVKDMAGMLQNAAGQFMS